MRRSRDAMLLGVLMVTVAAVTGQEPAAPGTPASATVPMPFRSYIAYDGRVLRTNLAEVEVKDLEKFPAGSNVNLATLREAKLVDSEKPFAGVRIKGDGQISKKLIVEADYFDFPAEAAIRAAGGTCTISPTSLNRQDKMHCLVCENGLAPVVAVFSRNVPRDASEPLSKLLKKLNQMVLDYRGDRFAAFAVFLRTEAGTKDVIVKQADGTETKLALDKEFPDDDRTKEVQDSKPVKFLFERETELTTVRGDVLTKVTGLASAIETPQIPFGLAASTSKLTQAYGIPEEPDGITVVLYNRLSIAQRWNFKPGELTDEKIDEIVKAATDTIKNLAK